MHTDDLGELYVLALHRGEQDGYVLAATGDNPTVREIAEAGAHGSPVVAESIDASRERLGAVYADALLMHQEASGAHARAAFGWPRPVRPCSRTWRTARTFADRRAPSDQSKLFVIAWAARSR